MDPPLDIFGDCPIGLMTCIISATQLPGHTHGRIGNYKGKSIPTSPRSLVVLTKSEVVVAGSYFNRSPWQLLLLVCLGEIQVSYQPRSRHLGGES